MAQRDVAHEELLWLPQNWHWYLFSLQSFSKGRTPVPCSCSENLLDQRVGFVGHFFDVFLFEMIRSPTLTKKWQGSRVLQTF